MDERWTALYEAAQAVLNPRNVSSMVDAGGVAAAIETDNGHIYTGVCVDTDCTLGICAERNAIFSMITQGESTLTRVLAIGGDGKAMPPCGACRELMSQLMPEHYREVEILLDLESEKVKTLGELTPEWWFSNTSC